MQIFLKAYLTQSNIDRLNLKQPSDFNNWFEKALEIVINMFSWYVINCRE